MIIIMRENYERSDKELLKGATKAVKVFEIASFTLITQFIVVFQTSFTFVSALQANELVSGLIKDDISSSEILYKVIVILLLIPVTLLFGYIYRLIHLRDDYSARYNKYMVTSRESYMNNEDPE